MKKPNHKLAAILAMTGLIAISPDCALAENEPGDNNTGGASSLGINPIGKPPRFTGSGFISNSDTDYYKVSNVKGYRKLAIRYSFEGSSPDTTRLRVLGPNGTDELSDQITDSNTYSADYTIDRTAKGDYFFICIEGASADGTKPYTVDVTGSPDIDSIKKERAKCKRLEQNLKKLKKKNKRNRPLERIYQKRLKMCKARLKKLLEMS